MSLKMLVGQLQRIDELEIELDRNKSQIEAAQAVHLSTAVAGDIRKWFGVAERCVAKEYRLGLYCFENGTTILALVSSAGGLLFVSEIETGRGVLVTQVSQTRDDGRDFYTISGCSDEWPANQVELKRVIEDRGYLIDHKILPALPTSSAPYQSAFERLEKLVQKVLNTTIE